ncbi:mitochondrial import receptor subunit TOM70-like isoform X3 [Daktulosphaira vitifoliae]|uniref:mitochondrial import receptor subunit TOM70-like isoform X1 n=1 Tax=Daktulosphaira vitifoliae TaxID=58002 RepID=UPI0021AAD498|nr:mitochondrial import receptor subunit TOM70-like isoform X1 [Daktulosphaira vitifoliae]XP_050547943.1 mitochondrial import receptor subunit TOM70-like isoform X2 [Daktulosphaira vitifoliae]XP_050547947.1 mitochondrial import receptor subunit TOM70-like isoform X3 [Daktulosphaira vitifoliae]
MSDSTESGFNFLSNWKFGLAVCVPCFAVGLGVTYFIYTRRGEHRDKALCNDHVAINIKSVKKAESNGTVQNVIKDPKKELVEQIEDFKKKGNTEFSKGNYDAAITFYTQALSMCPDSEKGLLSVVYQNRAAAYSKLNNHENCVSDCSKALELVPTYKKALSRRARALTELGNFKLALEDITAVIMLDEFKNQSDLMFADSVIKGLGKKNLAEFTKSHVFNLPTKTFIDNYMKSFCDDPFNDEFSQALLQSDVNNGLELALKCIRDKKYENIEEACKEELNKTDNSVVRRTLALNLLATFSILRGNYSEGLQHLTAVIETSGVPNKLIINSLIKRASVYHQQEQVEKSFEDLKRAEQIDPNSSVVYHHRAQIYLLEMNSEKAVEDFKKAVELNPTFVLSSVQSCYAQYIHAKQTSNEMDAEKFIRKLKNFIINHPDHAESYTLYAQALSEKGAYEEADSLFKKVHEIYPENATFLVHRALIALSWKNSINDAFDLLEKALKIDSKCDYAYETLGTLYIQTGKLKEAVECLEKAVKLAKSEKELLHVFSLRDSAAAQLAVAERLGLVPQV